MTGPNSSTLHTCIDALDSHRAKMDPPSMTMGSKSSFITSKATFSLEEKEHFVPEHSALPEARRLHILKALVTDNAPPDNQAGFIDRYAHRVTRADVFDFDNTLFGSPLPSRELWDSHFIGLLTQSGIIYKGWWQDPRSLEVSEEHRSQGWNEDVVAEVRRSMEDKNTLTILLTGRKRPAFIDLIQSMISEKGFHFDIICLKPDDDELFSNTLTYKLQFLDQLLLTYPLLREMYLWEDRVAHVKKFDGYIASKIAEGRLQAGKVHEVEDRRVVLEPARELEIIEGILRDHNERARLLRDRPDESAAFEAPTWWAKLVVPQPCERAANGHKGGYNKGCSVVNALASWALGLLEREIRLEPIVQGVCVFLDEPSRHRLLTTFGPASADEGKVLQRWIRSADRIILQRGVPSDADLLRCGGVGARLKYRVVGLGRHKNRCIAVRMISESSAEAMAHGVCCIVYDPAMGGGPDKDPAFIENWEDVEMERQLIVEGEVGLKTVLGMPELLDKRKRATH
ncbi:uncharacterized protein VTP21DRAFT_6028 [Calcarisporiella thermophila]|uniref:uncharacterized protein n=1 Tax=Calcarisporiella thermophila TaxID=911321 RepID=UPI0037422BBC